MMELSELLTALPAYTLLSSPTLPDDRLPVTITKITGDSRQVEAGALFVAYRGVSLDGHRFIPDALARGAAAVVLETGASGRVGEWASQRLANEGAVSPTSRFGSVQPPTSNLQPPVFISVPDGREALAYLAAAWYAFPARRLTMVGITGTDGKTTTTNFLYAMLRAGGRRVSMINTVNAIIGNEVLETGLHTTTPDAPDVQRYLARTVEAGAETCLLEVTSHGLAQQRVAACDFDIAIVTNITHEHLDLHGSLAAYQAAKVKLFESLATAAIKGRPKAGVLNCDDSSFSYLKDTLLALSLPWAGYSLANSPQARLTATDISTRPDKTVFTVRGPGYTFAAETRLIGDYNVSNCLAAATAAIEYLGLPIAAVQQGIAALPGVPGRMERIDEGQPFMAIVDFAHTPNALRRALTTARQLTAGRVIAVFGCAGLRDVEKRILMGEVAAELADLTIITAEDPRTEDLATIMTETANAMRSRGGIDGETFIQEPDRGRAIYRAVQLARPGEIVLTLGKGHEQSMCFGQVEYPWDDRQAMRAALRGEPLLTLPTGRMKDEG